MANEQNVGSRNDLVTVGCKLPHGFLAELIPTPDNTPNNWNPKIAGPRIHFKGANSLREGRVATPNPRILECGKTRVPREFWEKWKERPEAKELIAKGLVFAETKQEDFKAHARDSLEAKTGLEGLNPEGNDERLKRIQIPGKPETRVETDKEHLAKLQRNMDQAAA